MKGVSAADAAYTTKRLPSVDSKEKARLAFSAESSATCEERCEWEVV